MAIVLHLIPAADWDGLAPGAAVTNPSLSSEGFIHCTDDASVLTKVANAFYRSVPGEFLVLHVDTDHLTSECIWEDPAHMGNDAPPFAPQFPHIYGPIDRAAVVAWQSVVRDVDGSFTGYGPIHDI